MKLDIANDAPPCVYLPRGRAYAVVEGRDTIVALFVSPDRARDYVLNREVSRIVVVEIP